MCSIATCGRRVLATNYSALCKTETIAPHIHVLYRDIPHILCIIAAGRGSHSLELKALEFRHPFFIL